MFKSIYPFTGEVIAEYSADIEPLKKVRSAEKAFATWHRTSLQERQGLLLRFAEILENRKLEFAKTITYEMGKRYSEALSEVEKCAATTRFYVEHAEEYLKPQVISSSYTRSYSTVEPLGVLLAIMPWNFPFWQALRAAVPNLLLGNTVLLKHASNVMGCAAAMEEAFLAAGLPQGTFTALYVPSGRIEEIIADSAVKGVTLTGSGPAGSSVASLAGKYLKKSVLELGGSDPFVVLKDAKLSEAVETAVLSRFQNAGQTCIAAKRWIIEDSIYHDFMDLALEKVKSLRPGDPFAHTTNLAPVSREDLAETLENQVNYLIREGATPRIKGERQACLLSPTVLEISADLSRNYKEELFGPVALMLRAKDAEEAITMANQTSFGLGASLWTQDLEKAAYYLRQIRAGAVYLNSMVKSEGALPFGGIGESGYGRELGKYGMHEFANLKTYAIHI
jgi:succinate-semialdehyde dehydrogenase/glutarate-semialdehyde dehydrogenase